MVKKPSVAIILLNFNASKMTLSEVGDVGKLDTSKVNALCVVVDNNSQDNPDKLLKNISLRNMDYKYIKNDSNLGFAGGNNTGIKYALKNDFDYVLILNNDLILEKNLLNKLIEFMENNLNVGIASPKIYFAKNYEFHKNRYKTNELGKVIWYAGGLVDQKNVYTSHRGVDEVDNNQFSETVETDLASGACMIVRSEIFKKVGLIDESFFLYWEDADFSKQVINSGYTVVYYPNASVWHKVSASTGGSGSEMNDYFLTRNRYFYSFRYSPPRTKFAVFRDTFKLMFLGRKWQRIGALDAILGVKGIGKWKFHA